MLVPLSVTALWKSWLGRDPLDRVLDLASRESLRFLVRFESCSFHRLTRHCFCLTTWTKHSVCSLKSEDSSLIGSVHPLRLFLSWEREGGEREVLLTLTIRLREIFLRKKCSWHSHCQVGDFPLNLKVFLPIKGSFEDKKKKGIFERLFRRKIRSSIQIMAKILK